MRKGAARRIVRQYTPEVARLFGVDPAQLQFNVVRGLTASSSDGRLAQGGGGVIDIDRNFLRTGNRNDIRGALIHEVTHALGIDNGRGKRGEVFADYARYRLNPNEYRNWSPSAEVLNMAEKRGERDMAGNAGVRGNGPSEGRRRRQTMQNALSKGPLLSPGQTFGFAAQAAGLQDAYTNAIASIRAQGGSIRGEYKGTLSDIRAQRIAGTAETEGAAIERGIVGSSADLGGRAAVVAEAAGAKVDARSARNAALAQLRIAEMQAQTQYQSGIAQLQAEKATARMEAQNQRFMQDAFDAQAQNYQQAYRDALRRILARGQNPTGVDPREGARPPTEYGPYALPQDYYTSSSVAAPPPIYTGIGRNTRG